MPQAMSANRPSDYIWGLVCGYPEPTRSYRPILMLKASVGDGHMNQAPSYVIAGWLASATVWAPFSDAWDEALRLSPRIRYFKFDEAMCFSGEFLGMSEERRNEKLELLINLIVEYKLLGVASIIPHDVFQTYFGNHPDRDVRSPYVPSVLSVANAVLGYMIDCGVRDKVDFCFDYQPDSVRPIQDGWKLYRTLMPPEYRQLLPAHPPSFLDHREVVALQAADLHAGFACQLDADDLSGRELREAVWGEKADKILRLSYVWTEETAEFHYEGIFGTKFKPS